MPDSLIESELFGYEKGAFTGAHARKKGRFELAEGGTLFLDEIGDINLDDTGQTASRASGKGIRAVGGTETIRANVRLITATNKDLEQAIAEGQFREDLYYRLNVFTIFVPPLRERKSDLLSAGGSLSAEVLQGTRARHSQNLHAGHRHADVAITGRETCANSKM